MRISIPHFLNASAIAASIVLIPATATAHRPLHAGIPLRQPPPAYRDADPVVSGTWLPLANAFPGSQPDTALLMTDGSVMMHDACTSDWYRLRPSVTGNYSAGTWHKTASMPNGYAPEYFASAVLKDGRLIVEGGEYDEAGCHQVFTNRGVLYNPVKNTWTMNPAPSGWNAIGDGASDLLPDGTFMLAQAVTDESGNFVGTKAQAIGTIAALPSTTVTWVDAGKGKADNNFEEGWTRLKNANVLTVDISIGHGANSLAEIYSRTGHSWGATGTAANILIDPNANEIGPSVRLPSGKVFQAGAKPCGMTGCVAHTGIFSSGTWTAGPDFPAIDGFDYDSTDGPAAVLPDGNVLVQASPAYSCLDKQGNPSPYCPPSHFFEFDGTSLARVNEPLTAPKIPSFQGRMLVLPSGSILWGARDTGDVEVYNPKGGSQREWNPTISALSSSILTRGTNGYLVQGTRYYGVSNGAAYGDDAQMDSNYPLVRITNNTSGHVCYARVYARSSTAARFAIPGASPPAWENPCDTGVSKLVVVVNGLASSPATVTVN
jgi:hypothetical protein